MKPRQPAVKRRVNNASNIRLSPRLTPYINLVLKERYINKNSEDKVHEILTSLGVAIHKVRLQVFVRRVLFDLPVAQAEKLSVDAELLRAIRCRVKVGRIRQRFDSRARRRRIIASPKLKPVRAPEGPQRYEEPRAVVTPAALLSAGMGSPSEQNKMRGTPDKPLGYKDWQIINEVAQKKVFAKDRSMLLNHQGTVMHIRTRHEYTEEELMEHFSLSKNEAASCFMTL